MKTRIWFNHWFNTAFYFINLIRDNTDGAEFQFFGTNENICSSVLQACDSAEQEPVLYGDSYLDYCLNFCKKNSIDIFVPRRGMLKIAENRALFAAAGVKLLCEQDINLLHTVSEKSLFYKACAQKGITEIPEYYIANTPAQFLAAYEKLASHGLTACFKPVDGEGGSGFRVIRDSADDIRWLLNPVTHRVSISQVMRILKKYDTFQPLMILEYLDGLECSVDCLAYQKRLLASVQRRKIDSRQRALVFSDEIDSLCRKVFDAFPLSFVSNIQIKYGSGKPKILEINPRMSGGLHVSCHSGINFPYLAVKLLMTGKAEVPKPAYGLYFTQIEKEIELCR